MPRRSALTLALDLKLFKSLLHHCKGDGNVERFVVTDPLDFQFPERLDELVTELIGVCDDR